MMTPREAMQQAIERAQLADWEGAYCFLAIATELRVGSVPDPGPSTLAAEADAATHLGTPITLRCPVPGCTAMTQDMPGHLADYHSGSPEERRMRAFFGTTMDGRPAYAGETAVIPRQPDPPIYEQAGETLEETKAVPTRVAHPQEGSLGIHSTCLDPDCSLKIVWIKGRGWCHDVPSHTSSCDKAAQEGVVGG
jgi:hypothetical protein